QLINWNGHNWAQACDFKGNDLSHIEVIPQLCGGECLKVPECTHYTWTTLNDGTCWLKKGTVSKADAFLTNDTSMVCGVRDDDRYIFVVQWNGQNWARSCDFNGSDLSKVEISSDLCVRTCLQAPECTHYTWTTLNGGTCWMKKGNVSKTDAFLTNDKNMICGIRDGNQYNFVVQWNGQNQARSCDFNENDLSNVEISSDLCGRACGKTPECTHYTWTTYNGGTCWMKKGNVSKTDAFLTNDANMICGIIASV
ncbi:unnamed protein product, partial [Rotaria sp. Silwood1]